MMNVNPMAPALEGFRQASQRWVERERARVRLTSGAAAIDALLGGGWPQGKVSEVVGPASSGRTGVVTATVAAATARGEVVAWLDAGDVFDPTSARAAGVEIERVLWVRPRGIEETVRAAELVLETGGFTVVVVDLAAAAAVGRGAQRSSEASLRLRLARAVERARAVALVLVEKPWAGTLAGAAVVLGRGALQWGQGEPAGPRWLVAIAADARAERGGARVAAAWQQQRAAGA